MLRTEAGTGIGSPSDGGRRQRALEHAVEMCDHLLRHVGRECGDIEGDELWSITVHVENADSHCRVDEQVERVVADVGRRHLVPDVRPERTEALESDVTRDVAPRGAGNDDSHAGELIPHDRKERGVHHAIGEVDNLFSRGVASCLIHDVPFRLVFEVHAELQTMGVYRAEEFNAIIYYNMKAKNNQCVQVSRNETPTPFLRAGDSELSGGLHGDQCEIGDFVLEDFPENLRGDLRTVRGAGPHDAVEECAVSLDDCEEHMTTNGAVVEGLPARAPSVVLAE